LESEDCLATLAAMRSLGVRVDHPGPRTVVVHGAGMHGLAGPKASLDMGNSGTAMRLFCGLLAGQRFDSELIGGASLMRRPMERVAVPLRRMGAVIDTNSGCPPVRIAGGHHLRAIRYELPMASAQGQAANVLRGLYCDGTTSIKEPATTRDHSERMLRTFGVNVQVKSGRIEIERPARFLGCRLHVPDTFFTPPYFS